MQKYIFTPAFENVFPQKSCIYVHIVPATHPHTIELFFFFCCVARSLGYNKNIFSFRVHIWVNRRHLSLYVIKKVQRALHIRVNGIWFELCARARSCVVAFLWRTYIIFVFLFFVLWCHTLCFLLFHFILFKCISRDINILMPPSRTSNLRITYSLYGKYVNIVAVHKTVQYH